MPPQPPLEEIREFINDVSPGQKATLVPVRTEMYSTPHNCHLNVRTKVKLDGGRKVFGWMLTQTYNVVMNAVFHCIWESTTGERIDVTPHPQNRIYSLFLPDDRYEFDYETMAPIQSHLRIVEEYKDDPIIEAYIAAHSERFDYWQSTHIPGTTNHVVDRGTMRMLDDQLTVTLTALQRKYA